MADIDDEYLTIEELSKWIKLSVSYLYKLTYSQSIPHIKIGKSVRFSKFNIQSWLAQKKIDML